MKRYLVVTGIRLLISIFIFAFLGIACSSQNITENKEAAQSIEELQSQLKNVLEDMHVPGMSIAIVHQNGPEWTAGIGKADLINDRAATAATLFRIGSVSKGFISLSILKLVDEGKLSLDDSVKKLAPEVWFDNKWEISDPVRIVHLLENTTGWEDMHLREFAKNPSTMTTFDTLDYDHSSRISRWRPGTRMSYCNSGPAVAAYIVEKISGKSFEEYVGQNFFTPIGMQTATYFQPVSELTTPLYHDDGKTPHQYWHLIYRPIGSINASASDMANYLLFYLNRGNIHGIQVIPNTILNRMEVPSSTWAAQEGLRVGYGLSNCCTIHDGFVYQGHEGTVPGGLTVLSLIFIVIISMLSSDLFLTRLGNLTAWSFSLFLATIVFAAASFASIIALWRAPKDGVRSSIRTYSTMVTIALGISTAYFAYWGLIGLRTWA